MEEERHLNPQTPSNPYHKSYELQLATTNSKPYNSPVPKQNKSSSKCFVYTLLMFVLLSMALLIFSLVVLQIRTPTVQLSTVTVKNLRFNSSPQLASLNMTVVAVIRVNNKNFGRFKFRGGSTTLLYENTTIGEANVHEGRVGSRKKKGMNVTMEVIKADNYDHNYMNFSKDIDLGLVKLRGFAKLRGQIRVLKIINGHRTAVMNCTMDLNLTSQAIQGLICL